MLLVAPSMNTSNKKPLGAKGIATRSKDASGLYRLQNNLCCSSEPRIIQDNWDGFRIEAQNKVTETLQDGRNEERGSAIGRLSIAAIGLGAAIPVAGSGFCDRQFLLFCAENCLQSGSNILSRVVKLSNSK